MRRFRKFLQLPGEDRKILLVCGAILVVARLSLWLLPFDIVRKLASRQKRGARLTSESEAFVHKVSWAVSVIAASIRQLENCLVQAVATQFLLRRHGEAANLRIGVAKNNAEFKAHAWVEVNGNVVVGGSKGLSAFVPLPPLKEESR